MACNKALHIGFIFFHLIQIDGEHPTHGFALLSVYSTYEKYAEVALSYPPYFQYSFLRPKPSAEPARFLFQRIDFKQSSLLFAREPCIANVVLIHKSADGIHTVLNRPRAGYIVAENFRGLRYILYRCFAILL